MKSNDNSQIVSHARRASFILIIVCIVAVVASYIRDTDRLERALIELDLLLTLIDHIDKNSPNEGPYPLDQVITGSLHSDSGSVSHYKLTLSSKFTPPNSLVAHRCEITFNHTRRFFALRDGRVNDVTVRIPPGGARKLLATPFADNFTPWSPIEEFPRDISAFKSFWNALASSSQSARVASIQPENGLVFLISDIFGQRQIDLLEIEKSDTRESIAGELRHWGNAGAVSKEGIDDRLFNFAPDIMFLNAQRVDLLQRYRESWRENNVEALATEFCFFNADTVDTENVAFVIAPAELEYQSFDWNGEWFSAIGKKLDVELGSFDVAFANLDQEMRGFESLSNEGVRRLLVERTDLVGQAAGNVSVFGMAIQKDSLLKLSVAIIVILQLFATRHLVEATKRMRTSELGDSGAFVPWTLLYSHPIDVVGSIVISAFPLVSATIILFRTTENLFPCSSPFDCFNVSGVIISAALTILFLRKALELRSIALHHTGATGKSSSTKLPSKDG